MASPITAPSGQIQPRHKDNKTSDPGEALASLVMLKSGEIARALPKHITPERMARIVVTAIRTTNNLSLCDRVSFIGCVMSASQLGLEVNTPLGQAYLIPRQVKEKGRPTGKFYCSLMIGYQGMLDLMWRSNRVSQFDLDVVREGDHFVYQRGLEPKLEHIRKSGDRRSRAITHGWIVASIAGGGKMFVVMDREELEARRARSQDTSNTGPWETDTEAMVKKTMVRELFKWVPKSTELATAIAIDEAPELGKSQSELWDPSVTSALQSNGLDPSEMIDREAVAEKEPPLPEETERALPEPNPDEFAPSAADRARARTRMRQPGEEG